MKRIYLDYAASTPVDPAVFATMKPYLEEEYGNPGSLHSFGQEAIAAVDASREAIAKAINAEFRQVIFTSSATEANNLALRGAVKVFKETHKGERPRIIVSTVEHESVLETVRDLEREGAEVVFIPVNEHGIVDEKKIKENLTRNTVIVSVIYVQNEIGSIEPIAEIGAMIREFRAGSATNTPLFHTDASQAFQFLSCVPTELGLDLMTLSSHKIYGPKGAGALYIKDIKTFVPIITGGGQEFGIRSGTENVPAVTGFAKAVELVLETREKESKRIAALRDHLWKGIKDMIPAIESNPTSLNPTLITPNILNVYFSGQAAQDLLTRFDLKGLAVSSGSACRSRAFEASYVVEALGYSKERAKSSIRFSLGRPTTKEDIDAALDIMKSATFLHERRSNY